MGITFSLNFLILLSSRHSFFFIYTLFLSRCAFLHQLASASTLEFLSLMQESCVEKDLSLSAGALITENIIKSDSLMCSQALSHSLSGA